MLHNGFLECTDCATRFFLPGDIFLYTEGDTDLSPQNLASRAFHQVLRRPAWCVACDTAVWAERLPSHDEFMKAAAVTRTRKKKQLQMQDELLELSLAEQRALYAHLSRRSSKARCLMCGSTEWIGFEISGARLRPPLPCGHCNRPLRWKMSDVIPGPGIRRIKVRAYSFAGELVGTGEVTT